MRKLLFTLSTLFLLSVTPASALDYRYCIDMKNDASCFVALSKLRTMENPIMKNQFFENGMHYVDGELFMYPDIYVAETDLDGDGFVEIIVRIGEPTEEIQGHFCKPDEQCLHYILQDRNIAGTPSRLSNVRAMGPFYTAAIGLSTDERVGNYKSLRGYTDGSFSQYNVYQYDSKNDTYFDVSPVQ